ncbi:MAG TPA: hypothetical protein VMW41_05800 [Candidatus Bathyarchaeia archaeon]|nr:hypothetical protein [Candidatus Bathyarchaeia archaeon]
MTKSNPDLEKDVQNLLGKVKKIQKQGKFDLSTQEDLSVAIMNLVGIEEHLFFTATKTGKIAYLDVLNQVREMRKTLLKKIIKDYEGEAWCISKHLLAASMRLNEVGTKSLSNNQKQEAWEFFNLAYKLYSLFWGINLGVVKSNSIKASLKEMGFNQAEFVNSQTIATRKGNNFFDKLGELVKKVVDCCIE